MIPPIVHEIEARSALNAVDGMPFKWSLNPYKGCRHACTYCYARAYHAYLNLAPSTFESQLFVKMNLARVLRAELRKPTWQHEHVAIGTATDPYQPLEAQYRITRQCLEEMAEVDNPGSVTTKASLVRRDIDVLAELVRHAGFTVNVSLISLDRELLAKLEPGAPTPASRLETIGRLATAGIPVSVFLAPVLPGITDQSDSLEDVVRAAAEHGASDVWTGALRLPEGTREHFLGTVEEQFPHLSDRLGQLYAGRPTLPTSYQMRIEGQVSDARAAVGIEERPLAPIQSRRKQLALPI
jgi:DNA repair photolyase